MLELIKENNKIPALYSQENEKDPLVYVQVKIGAGNWLLTEADRRNGLAFGYVDLSYGGELGYINLKELAEAVDIYGGHIVNFAEPKRLSEIKKEL